MTGSSAYLVGREIGDWPAATAPVQDLIFAAVRKDNDTLEGLDFQHCTFANVSFKEAKVRNCRFIDCAFLGCYFRKAEMVGSIFVGCKFLNCEFPKVTVQSCDFKYSRFENCVLPFDEMEHSLPREPNLREELARGLAISADALGLQRDRRQYRLAAIQAKEEHLRAAVMSQSEWYQLHYSGLRKLTAFGQLIASYAIGMLWGHGEKPLVLIRNILLLAVLVFPLVLWFACGLLQQSSGLLSFVDVIWLSITTFIPVDAGNVVTTTDACARIILTLESFLGLVASGLLITLLVRRMLKR